jgi:hypothetical protein
MNNIVEMTSSEFRRKIHKVIDFLKEGKIIAVTFGKRREIIGYFLGPNQYKNFNT